MATKALAANVIDQEFAEDLRNCADLKEALGMFYTYVIEKGDDPEALLIEWSIIEQNRTSGDKQMTNRLLGEGQDVSYDDLIGQLREGEVLVATWLRDPLNTPNARPVVDENDLKSIASKAKYGYYVKLRWFASTTGSENPIDYGMFD
ncbi:hypothetical protein [Nocardia brasiliensis]|uniref:hypothetical protein n=1 Tax=Nocardia brasiliensis TaxID=37326 RepID=UPI002454DE2F|nr:hypothetical protein [Nocardia brasiliensis]